MLVKFPSLDVNITDNRAADALTKVYSPNFELIDIFESSKQNSLNFMAFRFIISDGEKFFIMRPKRINKRSVRLWCSQRYQRHKNENSYCKASLILQFNGDIQTEAAQIAKSKQVYIAPSTKRAVLLSKSSYTVILHQVRKTFLRKTIYSYMMKLSF